MPYTPAERQRRRRARLKVGEGLLCCTACGATLHLVRRERPDRKEDVLCWSCWIQTPDGLASISDRRKRARAADPEKVRERQRIGMARHRQKNPIVTRLRSRLRSALKRANTIKSAATLELVGCTGAELMAHIEAQFMPGMTWENRELWHVDHIIPCAAFDLTDPAQQRSCFHYGNLRPLWAKENQRKSDKGIEPIGKVRRGQMAAAYQICLLP